MVKPFQRKKAASLSCSAIPRRKCCLQHKMTGPRVKQRADTEALAQSSEFCSAPLARR
ncbi:hypothetical protein M2351_005112 [Azospirillum canadense]|nr:hypothetical protein [Azospirillum canadense]